MKQTYPDPRQRNPLSGAEAVQMPSDNSRLPIKVFEGSGRIEDWELLVLYLTNLCTTMSTNVVSGEVIVLGSQQFEGGVNTGWITLCYPRLLKSCGLVFRHVASPTITPLLSAGQENCDPRFAYWRLQRQEQFTFGTSSRTEHGQRSIVQAFEIS
jgi:hypothetical protein